MHFRFTHQHGDFAVRNLSGRDWRKKSGENKDKLNLPGKCDRIPFHHAVYVARSICLRVN